MSERTFRFILAAVVVIWVLFVLVPAGIDGFPRLWASLQYFVPGDKPTVLVTVKDARSGDGVADARVQLINGQDVLTAVTDKQGQAIFESVPAGYGRSLRVQKLDYDIEVIASAVIPRRQRASFKTVLSLDPLERLYIGNAAGAGTIDVSVLDEASRLVLAPAGTTSNWQGIPAVDMLVSNSTQRAYILAPDRISAVNLNDGAVVRDMRLNAPAGGLALSLHSDLLYIFSGGVTGQLQPTPSPTARPTAPPRNQTPVPLARPNQQTPQRATPSPSPAVGLQQQLRSVTVLDTHTWEVRRTIDVVSPSNRAVLLPSRDGQRLYVAGVGDQNVYVYDARQYQRLAIYRLGARIKDMTLDIQGRMLYVLLDGRDAPVAVDVTNSGGVTPVLDAGAGAGLSGSSKILYAESSLSKWICLMDPATNQVWLIDIGPIDVRARAIHAVPVGNNPSAMLQLPASDYLYVANRGSNTLSLISMSSHAVDDTVDVRSNPLLLALP
jgi:YVTN family beta-propeller protein